MIGQNEGSWNRNCGGSSFSHQHAHHFLISDSISGNFASLLTEMMKKKERKFRFAVFSFFLYAGDLDGNFGTVSETKNGKTKKKKAKPAICASVGFLMAHCCFHFYPMI